MYSKEITKVGLMMSIFASMDSGNKPYRKYKEINKTIMIKCPCCGKEREVKSDSNYSLSCNKECFLKLKNKHKPNGG